jgi:hypothetical protein
MINKTWDDIYIEVKNNGCLTIEDMINYLKKTHQKPESTLSSEFNEMTEGDEDNF